MANTVKHYKLHPLMEHSITYFHPLMELKIEHSTSLNCRSGRLNCKIRKIRKIEHNPNQKKSIKKIIRKMGKQRNNSYLSAAEKRKEKAHSHTEKKLPQRRGRRRAKAQSHCHTETGVERNWGRRRFKLSMGLWLF